MIRLPFKKLLVWQKSMQLVKLVYQCTKDFPREEMYGLISQMRRASVSIASNIAEGSQRTSDKEFSHFILMARGSLAELETQTIVALDLQFGQKDALNALLEKINELSKMLRAFHVKLASSSR